MAQNLFKARASGVAPGTTPLTRGKRIPRASGVVPGANSPTRGTRIPRMSGVVPGASLDAGELALEDSATPRTLHHV